MRLSIGWLAITCLVFLGGCSGSSGPTLHSVSGTLTLDGQPLSGVTVNLFPVDTSQISSAGVTDSAGHFSVATSTGEPGAVAGKHKVVLSGGTVSGADGTPEYMQSSDSSARSSQAPVAPKVPYPSEYGSADTTPEEVEITSGSNELTIAITGGAEGGGAEPAAP
jgi:hypothetical protein